MAAPTLSHTGQQLYDAHAPLATEDERHGYALAHYLQALALPFDEAADLSRDGEDGSLGWGQLFDVDTVPAKFLPYLGQFVGVDVPGNLPEEGQRVRLRETGNRNRGSASAIKGAARQRLSGAGTVYLTERHGSPWRFTVATLAPETPETDWDPRRVIVRSTPGLAALWGMDNAAADTSTPDEVGGLTATRASAATQPTLGVPALIGRGSACRFVRADNRRWVIPGNDLFATATEFTVEAWVRLNGLSTNTGIFNLARTNNASGALLYVAGSSAATARLGAQVHRSGANTSLAGPAGTFPLGQVVHVAMTYDGTTVRLYQDGAPLASATGSYVPPSNSTAGNIGFYGGGTGWDGDIDEVAFYARALTPAEIARHADPTPTTSIVRDALMEQKPAGMQFVHEVIRGGSYRTLRATHASYADVASTFTSYADVRADPAQQ